MAKRDNPIYDALDMDQDNTDKQFINEVEIPDDPTLDFIIETALEIYAEQKEDMQFIEPKYRMRYLETLNQFLTQAKDAIYKKEQLKLQREKFEKSKKKGSPEEDGESEKGEHDGSQPVSRKQLLMEAEAMKRSKA